MHTFTFEFQNNTIQPLYLQLYNYIKNEIKLSNLKSGEKLPSKRKLSGHLKISQNTVETAYEQLRAEGYIRSIPKSGYYICKFEDAFPNSNRKQQSSQDLGEVSQIKKDYKFDFKTNTVDLTFFPFATWARITKEIMHDENRELLKLAHPQGDICLRNEIAHYLYEARGVQCLPDQIVIGAGTEYLIGLLVQILGRDKIFAVENPGYAKTYQILRGHDVKVNLIGLDEEGISINQLARSNSEVVYITPSHHFPLGIIMPVNRRSQLLKWAAHDAGRFIIEDDYDSEFRFNGRPIPALEGLDTNGKVIYISTFSKSIAPSIRISYMVLPFAILENYRKSHMYSSTVSRFEQYTLYKFMKDGHFERHLNKMRNIYRTRKDKLVEEIRKLPNSEKIEIIGENNGLHLLLKVSGPLSEIELVRRAEAVQVKLSGLSEYYIESEKGIPPNVVVLGYSNFDLREIEDAVKLLNLAWFK